MRKRVAVITAGILAGLMALGTANALVLDTTPDSETPASEAAVPGTQTAYEVGDAGTVTISNDGSRLEIVSIEQAAGWQMEIEVAVGREVEAYFWSGDRRIQFNAELEDGEVRVRARERTVAATNTTQTTTATTESAVVTSTGSVTYQAGAAGSVTISRTGSTLAITSIDASPGWSHEIEVRTGREVEMDFRNGGTRVQFNAEFEDGAVRVRVRTESTDGTRTEVTNGVDTTDDDSSSSSDDDSMHDDSSDDDHSDDSSRDDDHGSHDDDSDDD